MVLWLSLRILSNSAMYPPMGRYGVWYYMHLWVEWSDGWTLLCSRNERTRRLSMDLTRMARSVITVEAGSDKERSGIIF